jgi:Na+-translocating ferredoxin:NAD+ oxidoreductase RnfD subunit
MTISGDLWPFVVILVAGFLATDLWRWLGVLTAQRIDESSELLRWVRAVSTALVAGLVARIVLFPVGAMALAPLSGRIGAVAVGFLVFMLVRRNVFAGILAGEAVLVALTLAATGGLF